MKTSCEPSQNVARRDFLKMSGSALAGTALGGTVASRCCAAENQNTVPPGSAAQSLRIYVINADIGNAVLVVTPAGQSMLLDAGPPDKVYLDRILAAIDEAGVKQIDYVVVSHYHWDHYGTIPALAEKLPILNYVDHGPNVEVSQSAEEALAKGGRSGNVLYDAYVKTRNKGNHIVVNPGDELPLQGLSVKVVSSAGRVLSAPLPGAGEWNEAMWLTPVVANGTDPEDAQSVGLLLQFGKFRFVDLGDLSWNASRRLFCPENKVGQTDLYLITHHALSLDHEAQGPTDEGSSSCPPCEVWALRPRVAILSCAEDYIGRMATPKAWQTVRRSPGLEDIWQTHYQAQGGPKNNAPEPFIACYNVATPQGGDWIKALAQQDGSFTVVNKRNGFTKTYPARN